MNCPKCQENINSRENFCSHCGWDVTTCPNCGKHLPTAGKKFEINYCPYCGARIHKSQEQIPDPFHFGYQEVERSEYKQEIPPLAGGISEIHIPAKDYGPFDLKRGFTTVDEARQKMEMVLKCLITDDEKALLAFLDLAFPPFPDQ